MKADTPKHRSKGPAELDPALTSYQSGVWRIVSLRPVRKTLRSYWEPISSRWETARGSTYVFEFLADIYHLEPLLFTIYVLCNAFSGINDAFTLLYTNQLLTKVEHAITGTGGPDVKGIMLALVLHLSVNILSSLWKWAWQRTEPKLNSRISTFCKVRIMQANLSRDLPSSQDSSNVLSSAMPYMAQHSLRSIIESVRIISSTISQVIVVFRLMRQHDDGILLVGFCFGYALIQRRMTRGGSLWQDTLYYASNFDYRRMLALTDIATSAEYKQEVIGGGLGEYLMTEYENAGSRIPDATDEPEIYTSMDSTPFDTCALVVLESLPLMYCVMRIMQNPATFSLTYLTTLQRTSSVIQSTLMSVFWLDNMLQNITFVKSLYVKDPEESKEPVGDMPFPSAESKPEEGMFIEMRDVSFKYPGSKDDKLALQDVSFTIAPSSLVVIVGANGSGKSSIVKLLCQLYRPTSGKIFIGGQPAETYRPQDLYGATALLTQQHAIFPLTLAENIGLGDPMDADNLKKIYEAARLGGADEFINKLENKFEEELQPIQTCGTRSFRLPEGPLRDFRKNIERQQEISGGESQRLAAARTFMRIMSGRTKLVIVDEPTSAIDPTGEYELFERLRSMRAGKTMIFVTHRFGHLTKHANLILCMKEGKLVESGTHQELMEKSGEYSKLYDVQARAFTDSSN